MIGIYKITNKKTGEAYIGLSTDIEQRWNQHINCNTNSLIHLAIQEYGISNFSFEVLEECNQEELGEKEKYWIEFYDTFNNGYNLTKGGGNSIKYSIEEIYNDYLQTGSMIQTSKNIGCSLNTVRRMLHTKGINKTFLQQEKSIEQIDPKTFQTIKVWDSISDAANNLGISLSGISQAVNGHHKTAGGFCWKFLGEKKDFDLTRKKQKNVFSRKIAQYTVKGEYIQSFDKILDALKYLNKPTTSSMITLCCRGVKKSAYGYKWKYIDKALVEE